MTAPLGGPIVCPLFIGRAAHLQLLEHHLVDVLRGSGHTVAIAGEAGLGKSRLAREARAHAERLGYLCLEGHCFEPDGGLPLAPLADLLRTYGSRHPSVSLETFLGPAVEPLGRVLPDLLGPPPARDPAADTEQEQRRLLHLVSDAFVRLSGRHPLFLLFEDLHWGDDLTLDLLLDLAHRVPLHPILLFVTYRSDEVTPGLRHLAAELDRERLATEVVLSPLERGEVEAMVRAILGGSVPPGFVQSMAELTEGNPFFVEEILRTVLQAGGSGVSISALQMSHELRIPRTVQDAVRRRVDRLSDGARVSLQIAAVAGRRFDLTLLQALLHCDEDELLERIKELMGAELVVEETPDRFSFRHALTREAIYGELLGRERRSLHRQVAETIEAIAGPTQETRLPDLARHYFEAGEWEPALQYGVRAGELAQSLYAPRAAVEHFTRALDAARQLQQDPSPSVLRARGAAHATLGAFDQARADFEAALGSARAAGDRVGEWQGLLDLGQLWAARDYARTGELYREALALARVQDDSVRVARTLNALGNWHLNVEEPDPGLRYHEEALAIFERAGDEGGIAETLDLLGLAHNMIGDLIRSRDSYEQAIARFRAQNDRLHCASSLSVLSSRAMGYVTDTLVWAVANPSDPVREIEEAVQLAAAIDWRSGEAYARSLLGDILATQGELGRGLASLQEARSIALEIAHGEWQVVADCSLGVLYRELLDLPRAEQHLSRALVQARAMDAQYWVRIAGGLFAAVQVAGRQLVQARGTLNGLLSSDMPMLALGQRLCWLARAELALAEREPAHTLEVVDQLLASAPGAPEGGTIPHLDWLRARALIELDRTEAAARTLRRAADAALAQRRRPLAWRILLTLGRALRGQGHREDAERALATARQIVAELAASLPDDAERARFQQEVARMLPAAPTPTDRQRVRQAFGGLTAREREVAALIAQGMSNRAIADTLVLSERTVEGYVANVLAKLGFNARTQIAAWAAEVGLARGGTTR